MWISWEVKQSGPRSDTLWFHNHFHLHCGEKFEVPGKMALDLIYRWGRITALVFIYVVVIKDSFLTISIRSQR